MEKFNFSNTNSNVKVVNSIVDLLVDYNFFFRNFCGTAYDFRALSLDKLFERLSNLFGPESEYPICEMESVVRLLNDNLGYLYDVSYMGTAKLVEKVLKHSLSHNLTLVTEPYVTFIKKHVDSLDWQLAKQFLLSNLTICSFGKTELTDAILDGLNCTEGVLMGIINSNRPLYEYENFIHNLDKKGAYVCSSPWRRWFKYRYIDFCETKNSKRAFKDSFSYLKYTEACELDSTGKLPEAVVEALFKKLDRIEKR